MTALAEFKRESDAFWADMRQRANAVESGIAQAEQDADNLLLDITRAQMAAEQ